MGRVAIKLGSKLIVKAIRGGFKFVKVTRHKVGILVARTRMLQAEVSAAALA